ncbi:MAG: hypothetical protein R6X10_07925 [Desulfobacterales bacterium]
MITSIDELFEFLEAGLLKIPWDKAMFTGYIDSIEFGWITVASPAVHRVV